MTQKQPVFFIANPERDEAFRIETRIWREGGSLTVEKRAASEASRKHLLNMLTAYKKLSEVMALQQFVNIIEVRKLSPESLAFDYLEGELAERVLLEKVLQEDTKGVDLIVSRLLSIVDALPSVTYTPTKSPRFKKAFGDEFNYETECTKLGTIDLNLDNIIIQKDGSWWMFDYEWMFDFPVPKDMLKLRFLWYFVTRYKEILHHHAERIESVELGNGVYIPKFFYEAYRDMFDEIHKVAAVELCFQAYVKGREAIATPERATPFEVKEASPFVDGVEKFARKKRREAIQHLERDYERKLGQHKQRIAELNKAITEIQGSKTYRVARKLARIKSKILKRPSL